ncbi:MAG: branched-chain amino acid ABC transporter permease, partial [Myxococcota bacterium]
MIDFVVGGILSGAAYGLLAVGFVLIYRGTRIFNLAQGEMGALGLYVGWALLGKVPVVVAALAAIVVAAGVGLAMERTVVRRLVDRTPLAALAVTLGVGLTFAYVEALIWGFNIKTFPSPFGTGAFHIGGATITAPRLAALLIAAGVAIGLTTFLRRTRFGLEVSATTSDMVLARLSGIKVHRTRAFVWAAGGALSGVSAVLVASVATFHPLSATLLIVRALAAALLGG